MSHKMATVKILCEITQKSAFNGQYSWSAGYFLATEIPWKIMKNTFYFILTNWIFYWQIRFCIYYEFSLNQMSGIREVWKYWSLKHGFCSISQKILQCHYSVVGGPKNFKLLADISFESSLQNIVLSSLLLFLCACY